jgi:hypothetical protein
LVIGFEFPRAGKRPNTQFNPAPAGRIVPYVGARKAEFPALFLDTHFIVDALCAFDAARDVDGAIHL